MKPRTTVSVMSFAILSGCWMSDMHDGIDVPGTLEIPPSSQEPRVPKLVDEDPAPDVVEVTLVATPIELEWLPGSPTSAWGYNGTSPGPLIEAKVGDRVVVHFRNDLDEPTSVHWHGIRVPAGMDGGAEGPVIAPGEGFEFEFVVPDAGLFWYHPHGDSSRQVERGLHGPFIVRGDAEPEVDVERVLVLDDVLVDRDGDLAPFDDPNDGMAMLGRQGNLVLVDGVAHPTLPMRVGTIERWRIVNVANARYFELDVPGHSLRLVGTDGGPLEEAIEIERPLVAPGERIDLLVRADGQPGDVVEVRSLPYDRESGMGHMDTDWGGPATVMRLAYTAQSPVDDRRWPEVTGVVDVLPAPTAEDELVLDEGACIHASRGCRMTFTINGERWPDVTPLTARVGETRRWTVTNESGMDHPFHLHGFRFQVLREAGHTVEARAWKDTVNVPADERVELMVSFAGHPGSWMHHCHILEHADAGMMGLVEVSP